MACVKQHLWMVTKNKNKKQQKIKRTEKPWIRIENNHWHIHSHKFSSTHQHHTCTHIPPINTTNTNRIFHNSLHYKIVNQYTKSVWRSLPCEFFRAFLLLFLFFNSISLYSRINSHIYSVLMFLFSFSYNFCFNLLFSYDLFFRAIGLCV